MKKKLAAVFLISALILTSCNSSGAGSKTAPLKSDKKTSDNEVVWTLEEGAKVPEDNVKKLNEALCIGENNQRKKDGYCILWVGI